MRRLTAPPAPVPDSPCNLAPAAATRRALLQHGVWSAAWVAAPRLAYTAAHTVAAATSIQGCCSTNSSVPSRASSASLVPARQPCSQVVCSL